MESKEDPQELERKIEQASRIVSSVTDRTTYERLKAFIEELRQKLRDLRKARRTKQEITTRARELWEQNGRPADRDLEFWLLAESEISGRASSEHPDQSTQLP